MRRLTRVRGGFRVDGHRRCRRLTLESQSCVWMLDQPDHRRGHVHSVARHESADRLVLQSLHARAQRRCARVHRGCKSQRANEGVIPLRSKGDLETSQLEFIHSTSGTLLPLAERFPQQSIR